MDIGICGFGYSGSGAVIDLLKEYDDVICSDGEELFITYFPDGLIDLFYNTYQYRSKFFSYNIAIKRFKALTKNYGRMYRWNNKKKKDFYKISMAFLEKIIDIKYQGIWAFDMMKMNELEISWYYRLGSRINRIFQREIIKPTKDMYIPIGSEEFISFAKDYINEVKAFLGYPLEGKCLLNQPFAANNPEASFLFYNNPKGIIVTRDPRDIYIMIKHFIKRDASWIPYENVSDYIAFYRNQYTNLQSRKDVLVISFEDLIYEYEITKTKIEDFLEISKHTRKKAFFNPHNSVKNTRLFEKYKEYEEDIQIIEEELSEYIYPFDKKNNIDNEGDCFWD